MTSILLLVLAVALVAACGVFVAAEFALLAVDRPAVERDALAGDRRAAGTLTALRHLSTQLSGVQVGITLTNLAVGFLAEPAVAGLLEGPLRAAGLPPAGVTTVAVVAALVLSTGLTMVFGELVPKNLAISRPAGVAYAVQGPVRAFTTAMAGPIRVLNAMADAVLHRFGLEAREELPSARSPEELLSVVRHSAAEGALETDTATLLTRTLEFGDRRADDAMTPRVDTRTVDARAAVQAVVEAAAASGHSRFPVTRDGVDDVVGLVHLKAALAVPRERRAAVRVAAVMSPPVLVPSSLPFDALLDVLQERGLQMAVVVDEFGGTDGVVTLEDLLEELVGEVADEFDIGEHAALGPTAVDGGWDVPGGLRPDEVAAATGLTVPDGDWATVAGLFLGAHQSLPDVGDATDVAGVRWTVREMDGHRIARLHAAPVGGDGDA